MEEDMTRAVLKGLLIQIISHRRFMNKTIILKRRTNIKKDCYNVRAVTMTAMLAAVSYILAFVKFPVPLSPAFARMDLSDFPALVGAFAFGPVSGIMIELVKNGLQLLSTSTGGVGELANFFIGASFVWAAGFICRFHKTKKTAWVSSIVGSFIMGIVAAVANYFILLPVFEIFIPLDQMIAFSVFIPFIRTKLDMVLFHVFPFNVLKGLVIGIFTMVIYKRFMPVLKGTR
jgi:riboflavin transporter FmnP